MNIPGVNEYFMSRETENNEKNIKRYENVCESTRSKFKEFNLSKIKKKP